MTPPRRVRDLAVIGLLAAALSGCAGTATAGAPVEQTPAAPSGGPPAKVERPGAGPAGGLPAPVAGDLTADTLAGRLLVAQDSGDVALSPFSIGQALGMTYAGARGATERQIAATLGFRGAAASIGRSYNRLSRSLTKTARVLAIANALYGARSVRFRPAFLSLLARDYGAPLRTVDFATDPARALALIDAWVSAVTRRMIPDLLHPGDVGTETRLVLVNAVYLKALWASPFTKESTSPATFHTPQGDRRVATMHQTGFFRARVGRGLSVLELPYERARLALDVLLPPRGGLVALVRRLANQGAASVVGALPKAHADIALPKFELRSSLQLAPALAHIGMPLAFSDRADLSGMAGRPGDLLVGRVVHQARIRVDERGTEAAAATGVTIEPSAGYIGPTITFKVDRPFAFLLRDRRTATVLFAGMVSHPMAP